jgi:hypothetical protein
MYLSLKGLNIVEIRNDLVATLKGAVEGQHTASMRRQIRRRRLLVIASG